MVKVEAKVNTTYEQGYVEHAFILALYYLLVAGSMKDVPADFYFNSVRETISLGGDTDTNACIVGGLIGALVGIHKVNRPMLYTLLSFNAEEDLVKYDRPQQFNVGKMAVPNIVKLINCRIRGDQPKAII